MRDAEGVIARLVPMTKGYRFRAAPVTTGRAARLSRFACIRRDPALGLLVESPLARARVEIAPRALAALAHLCRSSSSDRAGFAVSGLPPDAACAVIGLMQAAGLLTVARSGRTAEDADPVLSTWEFADLLFHARSRLGRHDSPVGATFEHKGRLAPLPALKPPMSQRSIKLARPDLSLLRATDPGLTRVLEERRSVRRYGADPISVEAVGEFLYRAARVRRVHPRTRRVPYEASSRPYPSGGACYPLEIYVAVVRCKGLRRGLYHYDPLRHRLEPIARAAAHVTPLLRDTGCELRPGEAPPVLIMITARFARVAWKYRSLAYAVILKDVGVLLQSMYLVATAMGLAPCAIGAGDSERSATAIGAGFGAESSVGEFLLGTRPRSPSRVALRSSR